MSDQPNAKPGPEEAHSIQSMEVNKQTPQIQGQEQRQGIQEQVEGQPKVDQSRGQETRQDEQEKEGHSTIDRSQNQQQPESQGQQEPQGEEADGDTNEVGDSAGGEEGEDGKPKQQPKNTGGTKDHVKEQPDTGEKGGLTGKQPVGKIDVHHL